MEVKDTQQRLLRDKQGEIDWLREVRETSLKRIEALSRIVNTSDALIGDYRVLLSEVMAEQLTEIVRSNARIEQLTTDLLEVTTHRDALLDELLERNIVISQLENQVEGLQLAVQDLSDAILNDEEGQDGL